MKVQEKANELINQFKGIVYCYLGSGMLTNWEDDEVILKNAKICATKVVDEILLAINVTQIKNENIILWKAEVQYWNDVKSEINLIVIT